MLKYLPTRSEAIGLALLVCFNFVPGVSPAAPPSAENVVYVDNVRGDDAYPGTYDEPKATIQAGEDAAETLYGQDGTVVVWGGGPAYEGVGVTSSMKFHGNGHGLAGVDKRGLHFHAPLPVVGGNFYVTDVGSVTIVGFEITGAGGGSEVIFLSNVGEAICSDNYLHDLSNYGITIQTLGSATFTVRLENNRFAAVPHNQYCIIAGSYEASKLTVHASNNSVESSPYATVFGWYSNDTSELSAVMEGNSVEKLAAVWAVSEEESVLRMEVKDNQMGWLRAECSGTSYISAVVTGNEIESSPNGSVMCFSADSATMDLYASDNVTYSDMSIGNLAAITASAFGNSEVNAVFEDNQVQGTIAVSTADTGVLNLTATGNVVTRVPEFMGVPGIGVYNTFSSGVIHAAISRNHIRQVTGNGIFLQEDGAASIDVTEFDGNVITGAGANGIFVDFTHPESSVAGTKNNAVTASEGKSLEVVNEPVNGQIKVNGETISPLVDTP